jgi:hypothetical protein
MYSLQRYVQSLCIVFGLLVMFSACGQPLSNKLAITPTPTPAPTEANQRCPAPGSGRVAVMPAMPASHRTSPIFVYAYNHTDSHQPAHDSTTLIRYDSINGSKTEITTFPHSRLYNTQLSADGQWILFGHDLDSGLQELQMVRLDGRGLQTLYCVSKDTKMGSIAWSPDQKTVAFFEVIGQQGEYASTLKLLQLATGKLEVAVEQRKTTDAQKQFAFPEKWLDNTHLYVSSEPLAGEVYGSNLYLLDLTKGLPQSMSNLPRLVTANLPFFSFALSLDRSMLYTSQCVDQGATLPIEFYGPSRVSVQPALGGPKKIIFQAPMAVAGVHAISSTTLLLIVNRTQAPGDQNVKALAQNGLWKINTDGTGLSLVWHADEQHMISFNENIPSNTFAISSQGLYVIQLTNENGDQLLNLRSLSDNRNQIFAQASGEETVAPVGWSTT